MINEILRRFDEMVIEYLNEINNREASSFEEEEFINRVEEFGRLEECVINVVFAGKINLINEITTVVVVNIYDEVNRSIVSRVSNLKFTVM